MNVVHLLCQFQHTGAGHLQDYFKKDSEVLSRIRGIEQYDQLARPARGGCQEGS